MSSISAGTSGGTALVQTGDTTGALVIKTGGSATTAATFNADQTTTFAGAVTAPSFSGTASTATTATNLAGGSAGTVPYQSASGTTAMLAAGSSGQFLQSNGASAPSWAALSAGYTLGTVVSPTGTSVTFTGIPSTAKNIIITFFGINFTSADSFLIRIGGSSGIQTTLYRGGGYSSGVGSFYEDVGFRGYSQYAGANLVYVYQLTLQDSSIGKWVGTGTGGNVGTNNIWSYGGGWKTLNETLTQVQVLTRSGSSFDNGSINIAYI